jgi:predicted HTH domain antitoxin
MDAVLGDVNDRCYTACKEYNMTTFGIKAIQTNPALLTKSFEDGDYSLITKHGVPVGLAVGFDSALLQEGFKHWLVAKAFANGDMSLGEVARAWGVAREEAMRTLDALGIPIADYSLSEEQSTMESLGL